TAKIHSFHPDRRKPDLKAVEARSIDTADFVERMSGELAAVLKAAETDDPKKLRARIAELERQVGKPRGNEPAQVDRKSLIEAEQRGYERGHREGERYRISDRQNEHKELRHALQRTVDATMNEHG